VIEIVAAPERVSTVRSRDLRELARAAYHLGNRHVALEVGDGWVRSLTDHVLDAMVEQLGLPVAHEVEPFEPEAGAYAGHSSHSHDGERAPPEPAEPTPLFSLDRSQPSAAARLQRAEHGEPRYVYGPQSWLKRDRKPGA
jgi:hypothetical protein